MTPIRIKLIAFVAIALGAFLVLAPVATAARNVHTRSTSRQATAAPPSFDPAAAPLAGSSGPLPKKIEGQVIVRFKPGTSATTRARVHRTRGAHVVQKLLLSNAEVVGIDTTRDEKKVAHAYERSPFVDYAEPNLRFRLSAFYPADAQFGEQWGLDNFAQTANGVAGTADADIDAPEAWDQGLGSQQVVVGVADSGVDLVHNEFAELIWDNPGETGGGKETNAVDDDLNGFVDDWQGWDFADVDNDPADPNGHGTYIAGIIGADTGSGQATAGVAPGVKLAPLRICSVDILGDQCTAASIANAFTYAGQNGMKVVSAAISGQTAGAQIVKDAVDASPGTLFVVPSGNGGPDGAGDDNEFDTEYPCSHPSPNILCVAATDQQDKLASFSNYGSQSVDLAAPGVNVLSTWKGGQVAYQSGTSASTGFAAGAAALVWSRALDLSATSVKSRLMNNVDSKPALAGKTVSGGRLNVAQALPAAPSQSPGSADPGWNGGSVVTTDFGSTSGGADRVLVQPDGKVIAGGNGGPGCDFALARYLGDGSLDPSFGNGGKVLTDFGGCETFRDLALEPETGKIVAVGHSSATDSALARYNPNGTLDTTFSGDGKQDVGTFQVMGVEVELGGRITAATTGSAALRVMRLNPDGSLDFSFGTGGFVNTDFGTFPQHAYDVHVGSLGIGVVGHTGNRLAMTVHGEDGSLDTNFSGDGKLTMDFGGKLARGIRITSDGSRWIIGGMSDANNNGRVAVSSDRDGNRDIWLSHPDGSNPLNVTSTSAGTNDWPSFDAYPGSSTVRRVVFGSNRDGDYDIYSVHDDGNNLQHLTTGAGSEFADIQPSFSPDGSNIGFASSRNGGYDVYKMDTAGGSLTRLTTAAGDDIRPSWSSEGASIAFESSRDGNTEIYTMSSGGGSQTNRSSNGAADTAPSWSPDGNKIAFRSTRAPAGIYVMNADGSSQTHVPNTTVSDMAPAWSPDGSKLIISNASDTFTIDPDGNNRQQVTTTDAFSYLEPDWQPMGGFTLARIGGDGTPDPSFSGDGKLVTQNPGAADVTGLEVQSLSPGYQKLVVSGGVQPDTDPPMFAANLGLARYNDDGTLDSSFGTNGMVSVPSVIDAGGIALAPGGEVLSVGAGNFGDFAVARHLGGDADITVTPGSGLNPSGQTVSVSGSGFEPNDSLEISQCHLPTCFALTTTSANASGQLPSTNVTVNRTVHGAAADCPDQLCVIKVHSNTTLRDAYSNLSFSSPAALEVSPSAGSIALGQSITLGQSVSLSAVATGTSAAGSPTGNVDFFSCGPVASPATCSGGTLLAGSPKTLNGDVTFSGPTNFTPASAPLSVTTVDYDGNSDPDLVYALPNADEVQIANGGSGGSFSPGDSYAVGDNPQSVAVGNFDGDSDQDLAVANANSDNVSILLGDLAQGFSAPTNVAAGDRPDAVVAGEFNGDSDPDLAVANDLSDNVSILLGSTGSSFTVGASLAVGAGPSSIAVGNFNGDSDPDLAVANVDSDDVSILLGSTGGSFTSDSTIGVGDRPQAVVTGDFNADSDPDLAVANDGSPDNVSILVGSSGGTFTGPTNFAADGGPTAIAVGEFTGDTDPDLAVTNVGVDPDYVSILGGNSGASFSAPTNFVAAGTPRSITTGDFNADSRPDLAVGSTTPSNLGILFGGASNTSRTASDPFTPATAGRYCFQVTYSGDEDYRPASDSGRPSCISVRQPASSLQAVSDFYRTPADGTLVVPPAGLLQNDVYPSNATVSASQETNDANPLHGSVFINSDGSFTYIPEPGYIGPDDFTYTATQSPGGATSQATVTLDVTEQVDPLQGTRNRGTRNRGTRNRGTRNRELDRVGMEVFSDCHTRWVSINPQVTIPHPGLVKVTARLKDTAGNEIIGSDYLVNDEYYGDPFAPTVLTWPTWNSPAPAGGAYVDVLVEVDPDTTVTGDEYDDTGTVLCAT